MREKTVDPRLAPGHLMAPFGWAAKPISAMLETEPSLYRALFTMSRRRMHLIALAFAHWPHEIEPSLARLLISGVPTAVLDRVLGRRPAGLKRALNRLPLAVLPAESYRQLIELLDDSTTAKLIYYIQALNEDGISLFYEVPVPLRRVMARAVDQALLNPKGLMDGLRFLASRGAAESFEALALELGALRQPIQMLAHIAKLAEQLPLPEPIPPAAVADARRLDSVAEIRALARRWKNCLAEIYLDSVNYGRSAIYLWPHPQSPAICLVTRHGRLGWAFENAKGPENADLPPIRLAEIERAFTDTGIPGEATIEAIENAIGALHRRDRHRRARRRREEEYEEMYEEFEAL
jgi:hypothetical protein